VSFGLVDTVDRSIPLRFCGLRTCPAKASSSSLLASKGRLEIMTCCWLCRVGGWVVGGTVDERSAMWMEASVVGTFDRSIQPTSASIDLSINQWMIGRSIG
jgi:hypothetical protein